MSQSTHLRWQPCASIRTLRLRAELLKQIRDYFHRQDVLEVETPLLSSATVTDPYLEAFQLDDKFLQTSPEYAMKRLLAAGSGDIFQITKAFRKEEQGNLHNSEFTLLEWYRTGFSLEDMFSEIEQLLQETLSVKKIDTHRYAELFSELLNIDIHEMSFEELQKLLQVHCPGLDASSRDECLTSLFATCIEPNLGQVNPCIVTHFPASQASLARLDEEDPRLAKRFEVYYQGLELANGFDELTDADEQKQRFVEDNQQRMRAGKAIKPIDSHLLSALRSGLPDCVGVALGIDRLVMLKMKAESISDVISFDFENA